MYNQSDEAQARTEKEVSQAIIDRKAAICNMRKSVSHSEVLSLHHHWTNHLHKAILNHTHATNTAVIARILALPRELRDTIYTYLWTATVDRDPMRDLVYWWDTMGDPYITPDCDVRLTPWTTSLLLRPPHFTDASLVGIQFATEVLKRFKDSVGRDVRPIGEENPLAVCTVVDEVIYSFVREDVFGVGVTMEELVRNCDLRVNIQCDVLHDDDHDGDGLGDLYLSRLDEGLMALRDIPYTERVVTHDGMAKGVVKRARVVTLAISQESDFAEREHFVAVLGIVARAYSGLRGKGFMVHVEYYSEEAGLKVVFEDDVWEWTDEEWEVNVTRKNKLVLGTREYRNKAWKDLRENLFKVG